MQMHEGRYVWVNGRPKHVSQLAHHEPIMFTMLGVAMCGVLYYLSLAL